MPHWLDSVVCKFAFPAPEPSYDADRPLRLYDIDGKFYRIKPEHPWQPTFADFDAELLWVQHVCTTHRSQLPELYLLLQVPVIAFPKSDASQVIVFAHANADDVWRHAQLLQWLRKTFDVHVVAFEYPVRPSQPPVPPTSVL